MIYALGEIVLIVIGISIAWKINDLNDIRKNNVTEQKIYVNLNGELNANLYLLKGLINDNTQTIASLEHILDYVGKTPNELTQGAKDTIINIKDREVNLLDNTVNSIVNTSKFEFIESDELKELIVMYPTKVAQIKEQDQKIKAIVANRLKPILEKYISLVDMLPEENEKYSHIKEFGYKSNYSGLLVNKDYQNSIIDRLFQTQIQLNNAKTLRGKTKILIKKLEEELN
jgi:hypothetical protein